MGIDVDVALSPSLLDKVSFLGTLLKSFPQGEVAMQKLLEMVFGRKRIERITERIGGERLHEVEQELADFGRLTLMEKLDERPTGVESPQSAAVMVDGGRYQRNAQNPDATSEKSTHWFEYKAGLCLELEGRRDGIEPGPESSDPIPDVPEFLLNLDYVDKLTTEIGKKAAAIEAAENGEAPSGPAHTENDDADPELKVDLDSVTSLEDLESRVAAAVDEQTAADRTEPIPMSPQVKRRDVVATVDKGHRIGAQLLARAWRLGMLQSPFKAFVGDGSAWIWTIHARYFKPYGFTPVLDIIHAVTYVYAAAMAGRTRREAGPVYRQWVRWLWSGELPKVIAALAARQAELGLPTDEDGETSPRQIVSKALTYLQNHQSQMQYPHYRKLGLPITSSHMESTIKELNYRIKGTEKFWSPEGGASVLQLKADSVSSSDPMSKFWEARRNNRTGFRSNVTQQQSPDPATAI